MAKHDASKEDRSSLERAQYEYRKTIYFEGLKILETFAESVIGRDPRDGGERMHMQSGSGPSLGPYPHGWQPMGPPPGLHINIYVPPCGPVMDGPPPGGHINAIIKLVEVVLSLKPAPKAQK